VPSPWWYRQRGSVIGVIFGLGFFLGYARIGGLPALPSAVAWGRHWGYAGVELLLWTGVVLVLLAWLARLSGTAYLHGEVVFAADVQRDRLIVAGPFRYVRNPLYLGNILLAFGMGLYAPPLGFPIIVIGNTILVVMLANEESKQLAAHYGADYAAYRAAVPAFFPRLTPATFGDRGEIKPHFRAALMAESWTFGMGIALIPLAVAGPAGLVPAATLFFASMALFFVNTRTGRSDARS
jgi:protein-S-isoprenylcysteine O-methyltransferase Ste14